MKGKITIVTLVLVVVGMIGFLSGYAIITRNNQPQFAGDGYVLSSDGGGVERLGFTAGKAYSSRGGESVAYRDTDGTRVEVPSASFLHYDDGGMAAFSGGVLVNFADLSDNFINNYYISGGLEIVSSGSGYTAHSAAGDIQLGDHLWKLSEKMYLVRSPSLQVVFSESDVREATDFVQVSVSEDGIVSLMTNENRWDTISEECYIQTATGVRVYPVSQLIDNGTYKMSVAKLSVSADDAIVLTEDEMRRQIVPELNITAEDGADGIDGAVGTDGVAGSTGTDGKAGTDGAEGTTGVGGVGGQSGAAGGTGESGVNGAGGAAGAAGSRGNTGSTGVTGRDAITQTTTNSALPTMTITDWQLSASSLRGTISVSDEAGALQFDDGNSSNTYCGTVTIYEVETGREIYCYQVEQGQPVIGGVSSTEFDAFRQGTDEVGFATMDNVLTPDTTYRLSVVAYYKVDETIYSREFITRIFYTDSTGVFVSRSASTVDSVNVDMRVSDAYQSSVKLVEVVLLTPEQNRSFTLASTGWTQKYTLDYTTGNITLTNSAGTTQPTDPADVTQTTPLPFEGLTGNSDYVVRVLVETNSGLRCLTEQELAVQTLKQPPEKVNPQADPEASYNRVTGGFEVYRPKMVDVHAGITAYEYTVYKDDGTTVVQTRRVQPQESEPVVFFLPSGEKYIFGVKAYFNDNEKQVVYDLGKTAAMEAVGATLPGVTFELESSASAGEFNQIKGDIIINLANASSSLTIAPDKPLELLIYADQVYDQKISVGEQDSPVRYDPDDSKNLYTVTVTQTTSQTRIHLDLQKLYKNTTYTVTLVGYLDLGDGNRDTVKRTIGTVSLRTPNTVGLTAQWPDGTNTSSALNKVLKLTPDTAEEEARRSYAVQELQKGRLTLELYDGTGVGKVRVATTNIVDADVLAEIYTGSGHLITEADFGNIKLTPNQNYTLVVTAVADKTARTDGLGYVNTFDEVENNEWLLVAGATPPELLSDSAGGVKVTPIYNKDAASYGASKNAALPDTALIGYKLQANYDNVQRLASSVTYYAQEYRQYYNALVRSQRDPIGRNGDGAPMLLTMTRKITTGSDTLPAVAVLFGGTKTASDDAAVYRNGAYVYYAGEPQTLAGSLDSGMGRGYRYVFSYTAKYSPSGDLSDETALNTYPYDHGDYEGAKNTVGAGTEHGQTVGIGVAYILNSGMCEAPRIDPTIHSYLYEAKGAYDAAGGIVDKTNGTAVIHYTYEDIDGTIVDTGPDSDRTKISWEQAGGLNGEQVINKDRGADADGWYQVSIPYTVTGQSEQMLEPQMTITRYALDYSVIMRELTGASSDSGDNETFYLCFVPLEHDYAGKFETSGYQSAVRLKVVKYEDQNYIRFELQSGTGSTAANELYSRAYLLRVTFTATDRSVPPVTVLLPLSADANGPYARMSTARLVDFVDKEYKMEAAILYDTGRQGWKIASNKNAEAALQFITDSNGNFGLDTYVSSASGGQSVTPSGALGKLNLSLSEIRKTVSDNARRLLRQNFMTGTDSSRSYYVYAGHYGVDVGAGSTKPDAEGRYVVPKKNGTYTLEFVDSDTDRLDSMTPTVEGVEVITGSNWVTFRDTFNIVGVTQAEKESGKYILHISVYEDKDAANGLYTATKGSVEIEIDPATGKPTANESGYTIDGLTQGMTYWYAVWMKVNGRDVILMDAETTMPAVYSFATISGVRITQSGSIVYNNTGYYAKTLKMNYTVSSYVNLRAKYDIFATVEEVEAANGTPLYDHAHLNANHFYAVDAPDGFTLNRGSGANTVQLNLEPRPERSSLQPGRTYYLKITVYEKDGSVIGSDSWPFTIPAVGNYGAYVYAPQASNDSVTFQVTLNDAQYSFMTPPGVTGAGGRYTVRFERVNADGSATRLLTIYDDQVFDAMAPKQEFVLNNRVLRASSALGGIQPETTYRLLIYAAVDTDHDGRVGPVDSTGEKKDPGWFMDNAAANFHSLINGFWNADYSRKTDADTQSREQLFLIAEKSQKTTNDSGLLVSDEYTVTRGSSSALRLTLSESYNVVRSDGTQSFQKLVWSVNGRSYGSKSELVNLYGEALNSKRDALFAGTTDKAGYAVYTYDFPASVPEGSYTVVLQLYVNESDTVPYKTLSSRFAG